jgi:hypothetical protein
MFCIYVLTRDVFHHSTTSQVIQNDVSKLPQLVSKTEVIKNGVENIRLDSTSA